MPSHHHQMLDELLLTYLLSHSRGTPLSHLHCPVGQLRSRVVGPEYVGHRWWVQGGGKVGRGGGGGDYYSTLQAVSLSASLSPHLFLPSSSWLLLACSPHSTPAHLAFAAAVAPAPSNPPCARATGREQGTYARRTRAPPRESGAGLRDSVDAIVVWCVSEQTIKST